MVGKITAPPHCKSAIDYISAANKEDKKATLLMHSDGILPTNNKVMAACLEAATLKGDHNLSKYIKHISLDFHAKDAPRMTDGFMRQIAAEYMAEMGIKDTEFIIFRHHDKEYPHCHLLFSRVNRQGQVISDSLEQDRNVRVCHHLTAKYGLHFSEGKVKVNRDALRGKDKFKYEILDKVVAAKHKAEDWKEFNEQLKARGIAMKFHYNNVTRKLLGVTFSDGQHSFSGKQLDNSLAYPQLAKLFGDINKLAIDNVKDHYEERRDELLRINSEYRHAAIKNYFPDWSTWFPKGIVTPNAYNLMTHDVANVRQYTNFDLNDYIPSVDAKTCFIPLELMVAVALAPLTGPIVQSSGGGGGGNDHGWNENENEDKDRWKFRFNYKHFQSRKRGLTR